MSILSTIKDFGGWLEDFFLDDEKNPSKPNMKHAVELGIFIVFAISYLKTVAFAKEFIDIGGGWQVVLLAIIGIPNVISAVKTYTNRNSNGKDIKAEGAAQ